MLPFDPPEDKLFHNGPARDSQGGSKASSSSRERERVDDVRGRLLNALKAQGELRNNQMACRYVSSEGTLNLRES